MSNPLLRVTLADGCELLCPDVCVGPSELESTDELWRTHGFESFTVVRKGVAIGWVPSWGKGLPFEQVKP